MAKRGAIVRKLNAIENFGSMDVLCTDKTGTLTEGVVILKDALDSQGTASNAVLRFAYLNAKHQTGLNNPLDEAINNFGEKSQLDMPDERPSMSDIANGVAKGSGFWEWQRKRLLLRTLLIPARKRRSSRLLGFCFSLIHRRPTCQKQLPTLRSAAFN